MPEAPVTVAVFPVNPGVVSPVGGDTAYENVVPALVLGFVIVNAVLPVAVSVGGVRGGGNVVTVAVVDATFVLSAFEVTVNSTV